MNKNSFQIPLNIQYGLIGSITIGVFAIIGNSLHYINSNTWRTILITSLVSILGGIVLGMVAFKDSEKIKFTLWKVAIFLMSLGIAWGMTSVLRLFSE